MLGIFSFLRFAFCEWEDNREEEAKADEREEDGESWYFRRVADLGENRSVGRLNPSRGRSESIQHVL